MIAFIRPAFVLPLALLLTALHAPPGQAHDVPRTWLQLQGVHDS